ncbi:MAG TPA: type III secretion system export apparatus subunit SctR [Alphaproteobacteria bacterium]|nr:type III secretion system export apparatus subunit SctR [Alphaproteobacteria bacterium]
MTDFQPNLLAIVVIVAGIGLVPFLVVTMTAFLKIAVVMFLIRNAVGIQQTPPNLVLYAIALVLTVYVSAPVIGAVYGQISDPGLDYNTFDGWQAAAQAALEPVRGYLLRYTEPAEREFLLTATAQIWPDEAQAAASSDDLVILVPAFVVSELTRAFEIGFLLYLPFIAIDLIISNILMSMGMMMVSPLVISVPFKLFVFVLVDGWSRLMHGLVLSYG